ncbi:hypothetical protein Nepgr_005507 [Nepenthes gracilis]|uniref:Uncharacterized protein n=1 Tax=Nepenthes gracilis TaxID=150966 RepID=A0AAD3S3D3_NEPGR|nr:hypothetical protein Nepgr_005507 [Nepenthes gracilis]
MVCIPRINVSCALREEGAALLLHNLNRDCPQCELLLYMEREQKCNIVQVSNKAFPVHWLLLLLLQNHASQLPCAQVQRI